MLTNIDPETHPFSIPFDRRQPLPVVFPRDLPAIPALPETLLRLDLLVQQRSVELREMTALVLSDIGATLEVLRLAGRELGFAEERHARLEDCICDLGLHECACAISAQVVPEDGWQPALLEFWAHSWNTAQYCRLIAENTTDINPDEAYLVGLLHAMGSLPVLLGWKDTGVVGSALTGLRLARRWLLPGYVTAYFNALHQGSYVTRWTSIVRSAHRTGSNSSAYCPLQLVHHNQRPRRFTLDRVGML